MVPEDKNRPESTVSPAARTDCWNTGRIGDFSFDEKAGTLNNVFAFSEQPKADSRARADSPQEPSPRRVQDQAAALRHAQHHLFTTLGTHTGVGRVHTGPEGIGQSLSEAGDAARLARSRPESGRFLHVDRLGLAQLLLAWTRTDTFQPAAHALLASLQGQPGDLVKTLAAYLDSESSLADTAAILGIHRNTVAVQVRSAQRPRTGHDAGR